MKNLIQNFFNDLIKKKDSIYNFIGYLLLGLQLVPIIIILSLLLFLLVATLAILLSPFLMLLWLKKLKNKDSENKDSKNKDSKKIILLNDKEAYFLPIEIYKEIPKNVLNNEHLLKEKFLNNQEFKDYNDIMIFDCIENFNSPTTLKTINGKFKIKDIKNFLGNSYTADTGEIIQEVVTEIELDNGLKITTIEYKSKYE